tara:strand:- start:294 stop:488 length:195 start_codon:yes stop_codon:yes gene_type:complete
MINDYINQLNMEWNKKIESVQDTIVADILEGLWEVCEDIYYDNLADINLYNGQCYFNDDPTWYN